MTWPRTTAADGRRELLLIALAFGTYSGVRVLTQGSVARAVSDALSVMRLERSLGIDVERSIQTLVAGSRTLVDLANGIYIWGHRPALVAGGVLLFRLAPNHYYRLRNVCLLSGALGLVVFALFPVAPPRLAPSGLQVTMAYPAILPPKFINQYAAMPSFHAGWSLVLAIELFRSTRRVALRALAPVLPAAMAAAVVATANHYVLDVLAGFLVVCLALTVVARLERYVTHTPTKGSTCPPRPRPATPATGSRSHCPAAARPAAARSSR